MKNKFTFFLCFLSGLCFAQSDKFLNLLDASIDQYGQYEKIYVHTDRTYYTAGGDLFFKVYLTDATLSQTKSKSKVAYVELISPDQMIVDTKIIAIKEGQGIGDFKITSKFKSGNYLLRAYTKYMRNYEEAFFFRKTVYIRGVSNLNESVAITKNKYRVQLFPEGGDLVAGLTSRVGIKAVNSAGVGIEVEGIIVDSNNQTIENIITNEYGFGSFNFQPELGQTYSFEGSFNGKMINTKLPPLLNEGMVINVDNHSDEIIRVNIHTNIPKALDQGYLIGQGMGKLFFKEVLSNQKKTSFEIDVTTIPYGILQFTIYDNQGQPRAERLVFNHDGTDNFNIDITTNKETYQPREKVKLKLDMFDDDGEVLDGDISLSVVENYVQTITLKQDNIQSYLLLSADIKGIVENPKRYFKDTESDTKKALDLLLLTQGWRRFVWQDILKKEVKPFAHQPEQGLSLAGYITKKDKPDKPVKAIGYLSELSANLSMIDFETDESGKFLIDDLHFVGPTDLILQAATLSKKQKKLSAEKLMLKGDRNIDIELFEQEISLPSALDFAYWNFANQQKETAMQKTANLENVSYKNDLAYEEGDLVIDIDSVEVTGEKIDKIIEYYEDGMLYKIPDTRIKMDKVVAPNSYNNISEVIVGRTPGLTPVMGELTIRGQKSGPSGLVSNRPRYMVNGVPVTTDYALSINPADVAFVDVLRGFSQLTMYGEYGGNGLIMIYLKPPDEREGKKKTVEGILNYTLDGYHQARAFYSPTYGATNSPNSENDNRVTLFWAPRVQFDNIGEAYIEFYTSDRTGEFDILVEGISKEGLPILGNSKITIR